MHRLIAHIVVLNLMLSILLHANAASKDRSELAEQMYLRGLMAFDQQDYDAALDLFEQAVRYDRKHADAWHMAAKVLMEKNTVHSRFMATIRLEKALNLDWNNPDYRFTYALLHLKKDMSGMAFKEFEKVIKYDPDNYLAYFEMAKILEENAIRYRDMIDPDPGGIIYFRNFAEGEKDRIIYYYSKTIALNPEFTRAYYRLALIYYEFGNIIDMTKLLEQSVKINPDDKNSHLFLGFAYNVQHEYEQAEREFVFALGLMDEEEQRVFRSIETIMSPDRRDEFDGLNEQQKEDFIDSFWTKKDPLFATRFNERMLEHYSRVAYANMRYSDFEKGIEGWCTDQGKVYIRYGKPASLYRTRPEFGGIGASEFGALSTSKEVWSYDDFSFVFDDRFLSNRYEFAWGDRPENDYRSVYEQLIREVPDVHQVVAERDRLHIAASHSAFFKDSDTADFYLNTAFPADSIYFAQDGDRWKANMRHGLYMFDPDWNRVHEYTADFSIDEDSRIAIDEDSYLMDQLITGVSIDSLILVYELYDLESDRVGSYRSPVSVPSFKTDRLLLSDIMLAFRIDPVRADVYSLNKDNLNIVANPLNRYQSGDAVYIYYEIYGLSKDADELTSFSIEYTVASDENRQGVIRRLFSRLGVFDATGDVTTTFQYQGNSEIEYQYQQIALTESLRGALTLNVRISDLISGQVTEKQLQFTIE